MIRTARVPRDRQPRSDDDTGEEQLVERAKVDAEAFGQLYDRYAAAVYRYIYARLRDRETAEDVTSEVFFKALRAIDRYHDQGRPFGAWLFQIAANTVIDVVRARRPTVHLSELADPADVRTTVEDAAVARVEMARVWEAVGSLTGAQHEAVLLKLGSDLPLAQIAAQMGRSEGAVKLLVHRAMASIRAELGSKEHNDEGRS